MLTITIAISQSAYRQARIWAAKHNTSVSALVQYCIERLPTMRIAQTAAAACCAKKSAYNPSSKDEISSEIKADGCETVKPQSAE